MLFGLAWRNVWRNRKRSLVLMTAIALGLSGGLFAVGVFVGIAESMVDSAIDRNLAHLQLHSHAYKANAVINNDLPNAGLLIDSLKQLRTVRGVSGRGVFDGMASSPTANTGVQIIAVNPQDEAAVSSIGRKINEGTYFEEVRQNPVLVGRKLAENLNLRLRSKLVLSFSGKDGSIIFVACRVAGIFETESSLFDGGTVYLRHEELSGLTGGEKLVHEVAIRLQSAEQVSETLASVSVMFPNVAVESWKDLAPELKLSAELTGVTMLFFLGIILFALLFGITNTMLMSVMDRVREFGVLMAIGMKRARVFNLIVLETIILSLTGGVIGVIVGALMVRTFASVGIDLSAFADGLSAYGISAVLYPFVPGEIYLQLSFLVIVTAVVAAVYPGFKATQMKPARAIRVYA
ncbi:MAG: FtsX-like permease family protein [Bacteroidota bacterium]